MLISIVATSKVLGKIFSVDNGPSILKSCIPPTFNKGKIVESGTHKELITKKSEYKNLVELQTL